MQSFQQSCTLMMQFVQAPAISTYRPPQRLPSSRRRCSKRQSRNEQEQRCPRAVADPDTCETDCCQHCTRMTGHRHAIRLVPHGECLEAGSMRVGDNPTLPPTRVTQGGSSDTQGQLSNVTPQEDFTHPQVLGRSDQTQFATLSRHKDACW